MKAFNVYYHKGMGHQYTYEDEIITCICGEEFVEEESYSTQCPACGRQYKLSLRIDYLPKPTDSQYLKGWME